MSWKMKKMLGLVLICFFSFALIGCGNSASIDESDLIGRWGNGSGSVFLRNVNSPAWVLRSANEIVFAEGGTLYGYDNNGELSEINTTIWRLESDGTLVIHGDDYAVEIVDNVLIISVELTEDGETQTLRKEWQRVD